jgi:hypothetical protein
MAATLLLCLTALCCIPLVWCVRGYLLPRLCLPARCCAWLRDCGQTSRRGEIVAFCASAAYIPVRWSERTPRFYFPGNSLLHYVLPLLPSSLQHGTFSALACCMPSSSGYVRWRFHYACQYTDVQLSLPHSLPVWNVWLCMCLTRTSLDVLPWNC